jgi:hypothetical protein
MQIENTFGNSTTDMRTHFKKLCSDFGTINNLGQRRFETLKTAFDPTIAELQMLINLLVTSSKRYKVNNINIIRIISDISVLTVDEATISYEPNASTKKIAITLGEPIPLTYIPRKPHPNGLLLYLGSSYILHPTKQQSKLPYVVDIIPHLQVNDVSCSIAVHKIMQR